MNVLFSNRAELEADELDTWWRENRPRRQTCLNHPETDPRVSDGDAPKLHSPAPTCTGSFAHPLPWHHAARR